MPAVHPQRLQADVVDQLVVDDIGTLVRAEAADGGVLLENWPRLTDQPLITAIAENSPLTYRVQFSERIGLPDVVRRVAVLFHTTGDAAMFNIWSDSPAGRLDELAPFRRSPGWVAVMFPHLVGTTSRHRYIAIDLRDEGGPPAWFGWIPELTGTELQTWQAFGVTPRGRRG